MKSSIFIICTAVISFAAYSLFASEPQVKTSVFAPALRVELKPENYKDAEKAEELIEQREAVTAKMQRTRIHIIKTDKKAIELHAQIMKLTRELAILVNSKKSMQSLNEELADIDKQINALPKNTQSAEKTAFTEKK